MKYLLMITFALLVSACGKPAPIETAETLVANPERLKELRAQCKADHAEVGDAQCNAVAEATRRRFMGGGTPYTPPASPPAELPAPAPAPAIPASPPGNTAKD
ncbi:hypothetical protein ASC92_27620 [Variovorax sp. Root411]|nr:EexN family lipoprotein [Variovorax sp. Root411]KQW60459.1 hypothetical protein ASC92_27620 [Variovorax sp. Root411]